MDAASQPFPTRADATAAFAEHVNRGKAATCEALGLTLVMGARSGARFRDAYDGTEYLNCHCNGGVFNLGHRNPGVIAAVRAALDHLDIGNHHLISGWRARLPSVLEGANATLASPIREDEVRRYYRGNARLWEVMLRLRRADRWWQRAVRQRACPFLLPGRVER